MITEEHYLNYVYGSLKVGMVIEKPRKLSQILRITSNGDIYYRIGTVHEKSITKTDFIKIYEALRSGTLTESRIKEIAGTSKPCNKTTIEWLVKELKLASMVLPITY